MARYGSQLPENGTQIFSDRLEQVREHPLGRFPRVPANLAQFIWITDTNSNSIRWASGDVHHMAPRLRVYALPDLFVRDNGETRLL